jgi:protein-L-isoaspartate(D-aspartate) O-methyltransferase
MVNLARTLARTGYLHDERLFEALTVIDRIHFVEKDLASTAYSDRVCISFYERGKILSTSTQPSLLVSMIESLSLENYYRILEIGTGTGFCACVLGRFLDRGSVLSIEINPDVAERARVNISMYNLSNVKVITGDGREGFIEEAPYDAVISTVALEGMSFALFRQMKTGTRAAIPVFRDYRNTPVFLFEKDSETSFSAYEIIPAVFMTVGEIKADPLYIHSSFRAAVSRESIKEIPSDR